MHSYKYILIPWYPGIGLLKIFFFLWGRQVNPELKVSQLLKMKDREIMGIRRNLRAAELDPRDFWFFISIKVLLFFQNATKFWKNARITQKTQNKTKGFLYQKWQQRRPFNWWKFYLCSLFGHASRQCHPCQETRM